ncbi:MAG: Gfo/Idh/MocA family oxidoreductase [Chloroflexi bacterium]|nr:Gfo/Idh/MocA family oxidoreductase [Chloroflexota bacterium]
MPAKYRVAVIGVAHMHVNELMRRFAEHPQCEMVAIADTVPEVPEINVTSASSRAHTTKTALGEIGVKKQYANWRELLDKERPNIVINNSENSLHGEIVEASANHGAHVMVEKPMADTQFAALRMVRAARVNKTALAVNWPSTWSGAMRAMKRLLDEGAIGRLWQVTTRYGSLGPLSYGSTHPGVKAPTAMFTDDEKAATWWHRANNGGGALLDYCCYGANLSRWYFGTAPEAAFGMKMNANSHFGSADDNAAITVRFPNGMAVLVATWSTVDHLIPTGPVLYGTSGTMRTEGRANEAHVLLVQGKGEQPKVVPGDRFPAGRATLAEEFIHHIETGEPLHPTMDADFNLEAMSILDAGIRSHHSGKMESCRSMLWEVGA